MDAKLGAMKCNGEELDAKSGYKMVNLKECKRLINKSLDDDKIEIIRNKIYRIVEIEFEIIKNKKNEKEGSDIYESQYRRAS